MVPAILFMCYYGNSLLLTQIHFKEFLERSCQTKIKLNSVKNEVNGCKMKKIHQTSTLFWIAPRSSFSPAFLPEIPPGSFLFLPEIFNFTLGQFLHETGNVAISIYKQCMPYKTVFWSKNFSSIQQ